MKVIINGTNDMVGEVGKMSQVGLAMIYATQDGYESRVVEVKDISILSVRAAEPARNSTGIKYNG